MRVQKNDEGGINKKTAKEKSVPQSETVETMKGRYVTESNRSRLLYLNLRRADRPGDPHLPFAVSILKRPCDVDSSPHHNQTHSWINIFIHIYNTFYRFIIYVHGSVDVKNIIY